MCKILLKVINKDTRRNCIRDPCKCSKNQTQKRIYFYTTILTIYICMVSVLPKTKEEKPIWNNNSAVITDKLKTVYQLELVSLKSRMKTPEKCVKIFCKLSIKTPEETASGILVNVVKIKPNIGFTFIHFQSFLQLVFLKTIEKISRYETFKTSMEAAYFVQHHKDN